MKAAVHIDFEPTLIVETRWNIRTAEVLVVRLDELLPGTDYRQGKAGFAWVLSFLLMSLFEYTSKTPKRRVILHRCCS